MWYTEAELYVVNISLGICAVFWLLSAIKWLGFLRPLALVVVCVGGGVYLGIEAAALGYVKVVAGGGLMRPVLRLGGHSAQSGESWHASKGERGA